MQQSCQQSSTNMVYNKKQTHDVQACHTQIRMLIHSEHFSPHAFSVMNVSKGLVDIHVCETSHEEEWHVTGREVKLATEQVCERLCPESSIQSWVYVLETYSSILASAAASLAS